MKNLKTQLRLALLLTLILLACTVAYGQITPSGDSYTNSADPTTNYGAKTLLDVDGTTQVTYIQFDLASIPAGASVSQATLKLYVSAVTTAGSFNVDYVNGTWSEGMLTYNNAPALGTTIASGVAITTADKNQYILNGRVLERLSPRVRMAFGIDTSPSSLRMALAAAQFQGEHGGK